MMRQGLRGLLLIAIAGLGAAAVTPLAVADPLPKAIRSCSETNIKEIGYRLGTPDSGSAISYVNGGVQISYEFIPAIHRSRVGDRVNLCLVSIPQGCPPGDERGRVYHATNLRTGESWEAPDSSHMCGGA